MPCVCVPDQLYNTAVIDVRISFKPSVPTDEDILVTIEKRDNTGFTLFKKGPFVANTRVVLDNIAWKIPMPRIFLELTDFPIRIAVLLGKIDNFMRLNYLENVSSPYKECPGEELRILEALQVTYNGNNLGINSKYKKVL